eukprot:TRINITY_DN62168_c0_g1_i2.p1 TRINITY_DN62168_c0_g1~~TRINITY_DN62168_c0_g1_i2.p1  ORF type:complete len:648 (-),score=52.45 TRINITY_DN62168_c0_g1_i2:107-2050(-)
MPEWSPNVHSVEGIVSITTTGGSKLIPLEVEFGSENRLRTKIHVHGVQPWWPNGFGGQSLYSVSATWTPNTRREYSTKSVRFGYRTVRLIQNPLPGGKSFFFAVNGVPIPIHGSNWIPADAFESRITTQQLETLFVAMKNSNQNMIRNWGGGIYQRDQFYDLADKHGVMIWEDMMWACNDYAVPPDYLQSAAKEVSDNVKRVQHHPAIAIWAGNNENEGRKAYHNNTTNQAFYSDLYFKTVLANISIIDTSRPLTGSSPSDGNETAAHPVSWNPQSQFYGDVHTYEYLVDCWDPSVYKSPRFTSEFGLQSWPSAITMNKFFPSTDQHWNSPLMQNRNHHPNGQNEIELGIKMHYKLPEKPTAPLDSFSAWLYMSQAYQAYCYKTEVEHFRRLRNSCTKTQPGCNMGQMFWQTNDIWPGASWASVDWTGRYKMVAYYANNFYQKFVISAYLQSQTTFGVYTINDYLNQQFVGKVHVQFVHWVMGHVTTHVMPFTARPASADKVVVTPLKSLLPHECHDTHMCFVYLEAIGDNNQTLATNFIFLGSLNNATLKNPHLEVEKVAMLGQINEGGQMKTQFSVTFSARATSVFTWLETKHSGYFDANGMVVVVPRGGMVTQHVTFTTGEGVAAAQLKASMKIWSLFNTAPYG